MAKPMTGTELHARIVGAEGNLRVAEDVFAEAAFQKLGAPDHDTAAELAALNSARGELTALEAARPVVERLEAEALAATRQRLRAEQRRNLERALRELIKQALSVSAHYQNTASAFRRMVKAGDTAAQLLFETPQSPQIKGHFKLKLSPSALRGLADQEINRLGLLPALQDGVSAPGTDARKLDLSFTNAPHRLPALQAELRRLAAAIMASSPQPLPQPVASEGEPAEPAPRGSAEGSAALAEETA